MAIARFIARQYATSFCIVRDMETVRYTYRLRPGAGAAEALASEWHRCRFLWNEAVHQQRSGFNPTPAKLGKLLTAARANCAWLREGSQNTQQQALRCYATALDRSFKIKNCGRPVFKSRRKSLPSLEYTRNGFSLIGSRLRLPKGVTIPVVWSRELPSEPTSVRVYQDSLGHWYASFVVRRESEPLSVTDGAVGIDWGVTTTATASDRRYDLPYHGYRMRCAKKLAASQRKMARRRKPKGHAQTNGYRRAKLNAAKIAKKAQRQNTYTARAWAKRVVAENQTIAIEALQLRFLNKTPMARKAADAAIGVARRELTERAKRAGRKVVMVQPAYTTMTCSECFARTKRLELCERTFQCRDCGYSDSRDRNAARVILAVAERGHTCVDDVRRLQSSLGSVAGAI